MNHRLLHELIREMFDPIPMVGYHVSPIFSRKSIQKYGIDPSKADDNFFSGEKRVFVFTDQGEAKWYSNYQGDNDDGVTFDIWQVDLTGLEIYEDESMFSAGAEGETSAVWVPGKIGAERLTMWKPAKWRSKRIREEIGRNMHTTDITPNTWDSFQDFEIEYFPQDDGSYLMDISFKGKKLAPTSRFGSQGDAKHHARMIVDKYRVQVMNANS